jgi:hypothetical protein
VIAALRSPLLSWISSILRPGPAQTMPGFVAKLSSSLINAPAQTYCRGTTDIPGLCTTGFVVKATIAHYIAERNEAMSPASCVKAALLARNVFSNTYRISDRAIGGLEARLMVPCTRGSIV